MAAFAVFMVNSILVVLFTGKHTINIDGQPTRTELFVLALLILVLPLAALVGWLVSRIRSVRARMAVASVALGVVVLYVGCILVLVLAARRLRVTRVIDRN